MRARASGDREIGCILSGSKRDAGFCDVMLKTRVDSTSLEVLTSGSLEI
jgi:hypothetical protein